jgi:hypothetical protein
MIHAAQDGLDGGAGAGQPAQRPGGGGEAAGNTM